MRYSLIAVILLAGMEAVVLRAQTAVDLKSQSRNIDFSAAVGTRPMQVGTALPPTCSVGQMFFKSGAPSGSNLYGCTSTNIWSLEASGSGGGGGGGITSASQLADFAVTRTGATTLVIGSQCSSATPCNGRFGSLTYSILGPGTVSISAGTGLAFVYLASTGTLTVGHNLTATCSGCVAQSGITAFPPDSIPLFTWSATSGAWDANGGLDQRGFLSTSNVLPGFGLTSSVGLGATTINLDVAVAGQRTSAPPTSNTACVAGSWATDTSYYYVCVAANTWLRAALSSW